LAENETSRSRKKKISFFKTLYNNTEAVVKSAVGITSKFPVEKGVLQGETASPTIFNLFIETVVEEMHSSNIPAVTIGSCIVHMLLFADDIALLANTSSQLQSKINFLVNSFTKLGLTTNVTKTKIIIFQKRKSAREPDFLINGVKIDTVDSFTYLGVTFHRNGHFQMTCDAVISKSASAIQQLIQTLRNAKLHDVEIEQKLLKSLVNSVILYCAPVWGLNYIDQLEKVQVRFWKKLLCLHKSTPGYIIRQETGTEQIKVQIIKSTLKFLHRLALRPSESLLGQCLRWQLRWETRINKRSRSWAFQVRKLLRGTGKEDIISQNVRQMSENLPHQIENIVTILRTNLPNEDVARGMKSSWCTDYNKMKKTLGPEQYLMNNPLYAAKLMAQCRINLFRLSFMNQTIPLQKHHQCPWCLEEQGDLDHYIFNCEKLLEHQKELHNNIITTENADYADLLARNMDNSLFSEKFTKFWTKCFKIL
jgi:hypothetical protein